MSSVELDCLVSEEVTEELVWRSMAVDWRSVAVVWRSMAVDWRRLLQAEGRELCSPTDAER